VAFPEETMQRNSTFVAALTASAALVVLLGVGRVGAADRVPGPDATSGASGSSSARANYQANYHADYRLKGTEDSSKTTEESSGRREEPGDAQRDWRDASGMGHYGRASSGFPR
jgi:hypothetical protein